MTSIMTLGIVSFPGNAFDGDIAAWPRDLQSSHAALSEVRVIVERHAFAVAPANVSPTERAASECRVLMACQSLVARGAEAILLTDLYTRPSLDALRAELGIPISTMLSAMCDYAAATVRPGDILVVATQARLQASDALKCYLPDDIDLRYVPEGTGEYAEAWAELSTERVRAGKNGRLVFMPLTPASARAAFMADAPADTLILDPHAVWADWTRREVDAHATTPFKLGIVGGIGPAATVDFMGKVLRNTEASRDQDHIKMLVEHNPQIPDRTAHLVGCAEDPTLALLAACSRLQAGGVNAIALPCNTAHAFIGRIQPYLEIPIVNMLRETVAHIVGCFGPGCRVGLLATSGTLASRVYHDAAADNLELLTPEPQVQGEVMGAIYGPRGVKAGFTRGWCRERIEDAIAHLSARGAKVIILGCTELPLIIEEMDAYPLNGRTVAIVDPTNVLARRCVQLAQTKSCEALT